MRKITRKSALALLGYNPTFTEGNTTVANVGKKLGGSGRGLFLHGNLIAYRAEGHGELIEDNTDCLCQRVRVAMCSSCASQEKGAISLTLAGWNTRTTRDRLNGILELMDKPWRFTQWYHSPYVIDTNNGTGFKISPWAQIDARTGQIISDQ
jgi:hypothetical protein